MKKRSAVIFWCISIFIMGILTVRDIRLFKQQQRIKEIDAQIMELAGQKDDLYEIRNLSESLFLTGACAIYPDWNGKYIIRDEDNTDITKNYFDNEDNKKLKVLLGKYRNISYIIPKNNAVVLECGYLEDAGRGSYRKRIVITDNSPDEETIGNFYALASLSDADYDREVGSDGVVVWKYNNLANKETTKAKRIYDNVWSFEMVTEAGILSWLAV